MFVVFSSVGASIKRAHYPFFHESYFRRDVMLSDKILAFVKRYRREQGFKLPDTVSRDWSQAVKEMRE